MGFSGLGLVRNETTKELLSAFGLKDEGRRAKKELLSAAFGLQRRMKDAGPKNSDYRQASEVEPRTGSGWGESLLSEGDRCYAHFFKAAPPFLN